MDSLQNIQNVSMSGDDDAGAISGFFEPKHRLQRSPVKGRKPPLLRPETFTSCPTSRTESEDGAEEVFYSPVPDTRSKPLLRTSPVESPKTHPEIVRDLKGFLDNIKTVPNSVQTIHAKVMAMEAHITENRNTHTFIKTTVSGLRSVVDPLYNKISRLRFVDTNRRMLRLSTMYEVEVQAKNALQNEVLDLKRRLEETQRNLRKAESALSEALSAKTKVRARTSPTPPGDARRRKIPRSKQPPEEQSESETAGDTATDAQWVTIQSRRKSHTGTKMPNLLSESRQVYGSNPPDRWLAQVKKKKPIDLPPAMMVSVTETLTYKDALKAVKQRPGIEKAGLIGARRTAAGHLLLQFNKAIEPEKIAKVRDDIAEALGGKTVVNSLRRRCTFEVKDIDALAERDEVFDAVKSSLNADGLRLVSLRESFRDTKRAVLSCEDSEDVRKCIEAGRIRIGFLNCAVKLLPNVVRCFRCHEIGHIAARCNLSKDIAEICRRCGEQGHTLPTCRNPQRCSVCVKQGLPEYKTRHITACAICPVVLSYAT